MIHRIEPAQERDLPQCAALLGSLFAQEAEFQPDSVLQMQGLLRIVGDPARGQVLVAREGVEGHEVLGMVSLLWSVSTALGAPVAWLEDLVVAEDRRGQGLGKALLRAAIAFAQAQGVRRITLLTDGDNRRAQALYASLGFQASGMLPMRLLS